MRYTSTRNYNQQWRKLSNQTAVCTVDKLQCSAEFIRDILTKTEKLRESRWDLSLSILYEDRRLFSQ